MRGLVCNVPQEDVLLAGLSPLEMLSYAAELRLCGMSAPQRKQRVLEVLRRLHLSDEEIHQRIGDVEERGLSGGQRKRVSIGLELLVAPRVLLVDEPTSGLDAKMAFDVVRLLKELAASVTVVATIHQPSWRVFSEFDSAVLLSRGAVVFGGAIGEIVPYFAQLGFASHPQENPADHIMFLLQDEGEARGVDFASAWRQHASAAAHGAQGSPPLKRGATGLSRAPRTSALNQVWVLVRRRLYDTVHDPSKFLRQLTLKLMVGTLVGVVWLNDGRSSSFASIFPTIGAIFLVVNNSSLDILLETVLHFPLTRALLRREFQNGYYSIAAYWASLLLSNLLLCSLNALLLALPVYALVGLSFTWARVLMFVATLCLMSVIGGALGVVTGCVCKDVGAARTAILPTLVPLLIFSGYVIPFSHIPVYFRWLYYASFFQYAFGLLQLITLTGRVFTEDCYGMLIEKALDRSIDDYMHHHGYPNFTLPYVPLWQNCTGEDYLRGAALWPPHYGGVPGYFAILAGYAVVAQFIALLVLSWKCSQMAREHT